MKRVVIAVAVVVLIAVSWVVVRRRIPSTIDYRGEKIKLTKYYLSYEDYKDDPDNIDPSETSRIYKLMTEAAAAPSYSSKQEMVHSEFDLKFPGYALGTVGQPSQNGSSLQGFSVEIPLSRKFRYIIYREAAGRFTLVDDFLASDESLIVFVREEDGKFIYSDLQGKLRLVRGIRDSATKPSM